jgi:hypothetical protein
MSEGALYIYTIFLKTAAAFLSFLLIQPIWSPLFHCINNSKWPLHITNYVTIAGVKEMQNINR